jgi:hypothetical protein
MYLLEGGKRFIMGTEQARLRLEPLDSMLGGGACFLLPLNSVGEERDGLLDLFEYT